MNLPRLHNLALVLSVMISLLAFWTGHLWRHGESQQALLATVACAVAVLAASALAQSTRSRRLEDD